MLLSNDYLCFKRIIHLSFIYVSGMITVMTIVFHSNISQIFSIRSSGGQYCGSAGLAEPSGPCSAGWYCESGAYSDKPSPWVNVTVSDGYNSTCPIYSLNNTGDVCAPGKNLKKHFKCIIKMIQKKKKRIAKENNFRKRFYLQIVLFLINIIS